MATTTDKRKGSSTLQQIPPKCVRCLPDPVERASIMFNISFPSVLWDGGYRSELTLAQEQRNGSYLAHFI